MDPDEKPPRESKPLWGFSILLLRFLSQTYKTGPVSKSAFEITESRVVYKKTTRLNPPLRSRMKGGKLPQQPDRLRAEMREKSFRSPKFPECSWVCVSLRRPEVALSGASERLQNGAGINCCSAHAKAEEPPLSAAESSLSSGSLRWLQHLLHQVVRVPPSIKAAVEVHSVHDEEKCHSCKHAEQHAHPAQNETADRLPWCRELQAHQTLILTCRWSECKRRMLAPHVGVHGGRAR